MHFAALPYAVLLGFVPVVVALYLYAFRRKRQALALFVDFGLVPRLVPGLSRWRQWLKACCLVGAVGCLGLALMQPQWGMQQQDVSSQGRDLVLVLDVSRSMLADDIAPNRLEHAKAAIRDFVRVIHQEGGHRLGLLAFAGRADLQCPLTLDYAFFLQRLNAVGPDTVAPGGTAIGNAVRQALQDFATTEPTYQDFILLTDGEDHDSAPLEAAQAAAAQQVSLYIIGIGDAEHETRIPVQDTAGRRTYLRHQGQEVRSRLQQELLRDMVRLTGGVYVPAGTRALELTRLYTETIAPKARRPIAVTTSEHLIPRYHWFVLAALGLLLLEMLVHDGNRTRIRQHAPDGA